MANAPPPSPAPAQAPAVVSSRATLNAAGLAIRKSVVGAAHTTASLTNPHPFSKPMQEYATEAGWGLIWTRPGLSKQQRSLVNLAMLGALGRSTELGVHVRGALRNGVGVGELQEVLLQVAGYAGFPAGMEAFRVAERVVREMEESGEMEAIEREKGDQGGLEKEAETEAEVEKGA